MPVKAIVLVKKAAPAKMNMIMQLTRVAPTSPCQKFCQLRLRPAAAMASEPTTPQAAHSVAVAMPATSTHTMNTISSVQGIRLPERRILSHNGVGASGGGTLSGFFRLHQPTPPAN